MKAKKAFDVQEIRGQLANVNARIATLTPEKFKAPGLEDVRRGKTLEEPDTEKLRKLLQERANLEEKLLNDLSFGRKAGSLNANPRNRPRYDSNLAK